MLVDIGGLKEALYIMGMIFASFISHRMYISSVIHKIYQVKKDLIDKNKPIKPPRTARRGTRFN